MPCGLATAISGFGIDAGAEAPDRLPPEGGTPAEGLGAPVFFSQAYAKVGVPASAEWHVLNVISRQNAAISLVRKFKSWSAIREKD